MTTITPPSPALATQFHTLTEQWHDATRFLSSPTETCANPAYRAIVALGPDVIPLILAELAVAPAFWFAALRELTGENPVPEADRGRMQVMADHWLTWGRARGLA